jgi:hypothetical protein
LADRRRAVETAPCAGRLGVEGPSAIVDAVAAFDGEILGVRRDAQEVDLTIDYRLSEGWWKSFWLRVRGSWLNVWGTSRDGAEVRVILRYDFPIL